MKTYRLNLVDELSKIGFILGNVSELPSALRTELEGQALDDSDKVLSRIYGNRYQVILPVDENELDNSTIKSFIYDVNKDQGVVEDTNVSHSADDYLGVKTTLDAYVANDAYCTYSKIKLYTQLNPDAEDWNKVKDSMGEILEGKKVDELSADDLEKVRLLYSDIPDLVILKDELPSSEPESKPEPEAEPKAEVEPELVTSSEPESTDVIAVEPEVTPVEPTQVEPIVDNVAEAVPELDTSSTNEEPEVPHIIPEPEPQEPEVTPASSEEPASSVEPEPEPEVETPTELKEPEKSEEPKLDLNKVMDRLEEFESKLDNILDRLGIDKSESLVSYGQRMKAMARVDIGGEVL